MATLTQTLKDNRETAKKEFDALSTALGHVLDRLGTPQNGPGQPSTGLYATVDSVSERVKPFEARWLEAKGAWKTLGCVAIVLSPVIWFLAGPQLTAIFHH